MKCFFLFLFGLFFAFFDLIFLFFFIGFFCIFLFFDLSTFWFGGVFFCDRISFFLLYLYESISNVNTATQNLKIQKGIAVISIVLFLVKIIAWYITNSVAILTDALESIVNVIAGLIGDAGGRVTIHRDQ